MYKQRGGLANICGALVIGVYATVVRPLFLSCIVALAEW
jgi:hypothetical protein